MSHNLDIYKSPVCGLISVDAATYWSRWDVHSDFYIISPHLCDKLKGRVTSGVFQTTGVHWQSGLKFIKLCDYSTSVNLGCTPSFVPLIKFQNTTLKRLTNAEFNHPRLWTLLLFTFTKIKQRISWLPVFCAPLCNPGHFFNCSSLGSISFLGPTALMFILCVKFSKQHLVILQAMSLKKLNWKRLQHLKESWATLGKYIQRFTLDMIILLDLKSNMLCSFKFKTSSKCALSIWSLNLKGQL